MTPTQIKTVALIIKKHFSNLTVEKVLEITCEILEALGV